LTNSRSNEENETQEESPASFQDFPLSDVTHAALLHAGYTEPTPIQAGLIPIALKGGDVMGQARTGTGKTASFAIPILERLKPRKRGDGPQALILVPTRELAVQVRDECQKLAHGSKARAVALYGGKPIRGQIEKLQKGADVAVGTPGRVIDLINRGALRLDNLHIVVLDEADRMLDIGFRPDIEKILRRCPSERQTMLLSATLPPPVERLAQRYMKDPKSLDFSPGDISVETIEQFYFTVAQDQKFELLHRLISREDPQQTIVFCRTKRGTDSVQRRLSRKFKSVECIHGDMQQTARDRVMASFRKGDVKHLVATDIVGRGIDVTSISHIINYDIPEFCDDYVHRVGRTGRMGREGVAYTFVLPDQGGELTRIEIRINRLLKRDEIEGFKAYTAPKPPPEKKADEPEGPPKPAPILGKKGRPRRRTRRAL
jgi:ATP-dependent RNA helicase DeaD